MVITAVCDLGLKLEEFYDMTLFEWVLELEKYRRKLKEENELRWIHTREILAAIINTYSKNPIKGTDVIKLSFDQVEETDDADYFKKLKSAMGSKFKK